MTKLNTTTKTTKATKTVIAQEPTAVEQITVATTPATEVRELTAIEVARLNVANKASNGIGVTHHTSGKVIKGLAAEPILARPQRKMLRVIEKINGHPGEKQCVKRFHLYKEGMTLLEIKQTEGLTINDVTYYAELGYLTLRDATDEEYAAEMAKWDAKRDAAKAALTQTQAVAVA